MGPADDPPLPGYMLAGPDEPGRRRMQFVAAYTSFVRHIDRAIAHLGRDHRDTIKFVDLACGEGHHVADVAHRLPHARATGVDLNAAAIARATASFADLPVTFVAHDLHAPWPAGLGGFDVAHCRHGLTHCHDPGRVLAQLHAVMAPGGVVCLVDAPGTALRVIHPAVAVLAECLRRAVLQRGSVPVGDRHAALLAEAGFTVLSQEIEEYAMTGPGGDGEAMTRVIVDLCDGLRRGSAEVRSATPDDIYAAQIAELMDAGPEPIGAAPVALTFARA